MQQPHSPLPCWLLSGMLIILVLCSAVPVPAQALSIEGTYQLVSRKLPDGTVQSPPHIMGALTYTKTHRNFNVIWKDAQGKFFSYSLVSTYKLTPTEYGETILFSILNEQMNGNEIVDNLSRPTQSVPVTVAGKRIQFKLPFNPPSVVFEGDKMTATAEGRFVDIWETIQSHALIEWKSANRPPWRWNHAGQSSWLC